MRMLAILLGAMVWTSAMSECLIVVDDGFRPLSAEFGITHVEWRAVVENRCDAAYDAHVTVELISSEGEMVHHELAMVVVQAGSDTEVTKKTSIPTRDFERVTGIRVGIDKERERPF